MHRDLKKILSLEHGERNAQVVIEHPLIFGEYALS